MNLSNTCSVGVGARPWSALASSTHGGSTLHSSVAPAALLISGESQLGSQQTQARLEFHSTLGILLVSDVLLVLHQYAATGNGWRELAES